MADSGIDGRSARRERGRIAAIDAMFALIVDGKEPRAEEVAERAGVSVASLFRYFDGLDDLRRQTFEHFVERYLPLLEMSVEPDAARSDRVAALVRARLDFYDRVGPLLIAGRARVRASTVGLESRNAVRERRAEQVRTFLAPELADATPARAVELVSAIDSLTGPEAWELLTRFYARTRRQLTTGWRRQSEAVIDAWS